MYDYLIDSTYIDKGKISNTLTKSQREIVKDKFKVKTYSLNYNFLIRISIMNLTSF